jgi:hypothetical protein
MIGSGVVSPLGHVRMIGELQTLDNGFQETNVGTITLRNAKGRVTVQLVGPQPTSTFDYTIVGGTGRYGHASGSGQATLYGGPPTPFFYFTFTLTFVPHPLVRVV